jgi:hypothetical protein
LQSPWNGSEEIGENPRAGRIYFGSELLIFDAPKDSFIAKDDIQAATRTQLGWERASGLGVRADYLSLDVDWHITNGPEGELVDGSNGGIWNYAPYYAGAYLIGRDIDTFHFDIYQRFLLRRTQLLFGLGPKYVRNQQRFELVFDTGAPGDGYEYDISDETLSGTGVSLIGELRHPLWARDIYQVDFLVSGRSTYVPGELEVESQLVNRTLEDNFWLHEATAGIEWLIRYEGHLFRLRSQVETHQWNSEQLAHQAFTGGTISFGLDW